MNVGGGDLLKNCQSTIAEKMADVHFPSNVFRSKIFKESNVLRRYVGSRFDLLC